MASIGVALGQAIGRWGNFFNQELYGRPTSVPWAVTIEPQHRLPAYAEFARFHPAFLYESLWNFLTFLVLLWVYRRFGRRLRVGDLTALYLILYSTGRILTELVRLDSRTLHIGGWDSGLPVATAVAIVTVVLMLTWRALIRLRRVAPS
jgi:phosphatidylglycerol:prolipoprotein diacylglycerol transferase